MTLKLLIGDAMLWILIAVTALYGYAKRDDLYFRSRLRAVAALPSVASALVVLAVFLGIALLDSIHLEKKGRIVSVLDLCTSHLQERTERTYSAPFATLEYSRSVVIEEGTVRQRYEPLRHVHADGFWRKSAVGAAGGFVVAWLSVRIWRRRKKREWSGAAQSAFRTWLALGTLAGWLYVMSFSFHVFGTDKVGGDLFYATLKSIRTGVLIGTLSTLVTLPFALMLGMAAGYFRGLVDDAVQYLYTTLSSVPGVLLIAAGVLGMEVMMERHAQMFGSGVERADMRLVFLVMILGITGWTGLCRMVRAETLRLSRLEYVDAARVFGVGSWRIMWRHILPNLSHIVIIAVALDFSSMVLAEAVLSYVGVGVDPTMYSWGNMINQARLEMAREPMVWWSLLAAFVFMFALVLSANIVADRVQHVLDPRNETERM